MPPLFGRRILSERELVARAGEQLRVHGPDAPLRSQVAAARCRREGRHEEARRWTAITEKLRTMMAETA